MHTHSHIIIHHVYTNACVTNNILRTYMLCSFKFAAEKQDLSLVKVQLNLRTHTHTHTCTHSPHTMYTRTHMSQVCTNKQDFELDTPTHAYLTM